MPGPKHAQIREVQPVLASRNVRASVDLLFEEYRDRNGLTFYCDRE